MRSGLAAKAPESLADPAKGVEESTLHQQRERLTCGGRGSSETAHRQVVGAGRAERGSGGGTRALPSPNHPALLVPPAPDPGDASANQEFEGQPTRATSGAGDGFGDSGARGATPRERGRRTACARRTRAGRGRRRGAGRGWRACAFRVPLAAGWLESRG